MRSRIPHLPPVRAVLCRLVAAYIRLVYATSRWEMRNAEAVNALWDAGSPFILAFWHGRMFMMPAMWRKGAPVSMLISRHRDGELIARTLRHFGVDAIRGSTSRGGAGALREVLRALKSGKWIGFTPDGPRGPPMRASDGVVSVARLAGAPIVPAACAVSRRKVLSSWDRFAVPFPFSRGIYIWGEPLSVPRDADGETLEALRLSLERSLNEISAAADRYCGVDVIAPESDAPPARAGADA